MRRLVLPLLAMPILGGCGLIEDDIADFELRLPEKAVTLDTQQWMLTQDATMPSVPCAGMESVCATGVSLYCAAGSDTCFGTCEAGTCAVTVQTSLSNEFDLKREVPELEQIENQPLADVTVDRVHYAVTENTMNVDSPPLSVYVGPQGVMDPSSDLAEKIGTVAPIPAGELVADADVILTADGELSLRTYMKSYSTPFNVIVGAELQIAAGDPIPTGRLVAVIKVDAHASPGL